MQRAERGDLRDALVYERKLDEIAQLGHRLERVDIAFCNRLICDGERPVPIADPAARADKRIASAIERLALGLRNQQIPHHFAVPACDLHLLLGPVFACSDRICIGRKAGVFPEPPARIAEKRKPGQ